MSNDKVRAEFEEWIQGHGGDIRLNGEYVSNVTECAWQAWQASRAALVVELPDICDLHPSKMLEKEIIKRLDAAGVKYK